MTQCQHYRLQSGGDGRLVPHQCRKQATATLEGIDLCTIHLGSAFVYGGVWFIRDGATWEMTLDGGPRYPLQEQEPSR